MISITCTHCQTVLSIDDAFAGGVCRCQHCGTIQTVPSRLKPSASSAPAYSGPNPQTSKKLYQNKSAEGKAKSASGTSAATSSSKDLDDLAQAIASSGSGLGSGLTSGSRNRARPATAKSAADAGPSKLPIVPMLIGGGITLAIVGIVLYFVFHHGNPPESSSNGTAGANVNAGTSPPAAAPIVSPQFCGTPISGTYIAYILDRSNSLREAFDPLKAATAQSIKTLGPESQFAVFLANNGGEDFNFPDKGYRFATSDQAGNFVTKADSASVGGASHLGGSLERAIARKPDAIILVTAKSKFDREDTNAMKKAVSAAHGKVKFYTFVVDASDPNDLLKQTSKSTGGEYREISTRDLRDQVQ